MLRTVLLVTVSLAIAFGGGIGSLWAIVCSAPKAEPAGWHPLEAETDALYRPLAELRQFHLALGPNEGVALAASRDEDGPLKPGCTYSVEGPLPPARFWTLAAASGEGAASAIVSTDLLQQPDGGIAVTVGPKPSPANWLRSSGGGSMTLLLSLYDTPVSDSVNLAEVSLPRIRRLGCDA